MVALGDPLCFFLWQEKCRRDGPDRVWAAQRGRRGSLDHREEGELTARRSHGQPLDKAGQEGFVARRLEACHRRDEDRVRLITLALVTAGIPP